MRKILLLSMILFIANTALAQTKNYPIAMVNFNDFKGLVNTVEPIRAKRLIDLDTFLEMSKDPDTIIFDSRSDFRFNRLHLKGAKHLNFSDYTQSNLANVIPNNNTRILIYCNNNFEGNQVDFANKFFSSNMGVNMRAATQEEIDGKSQISNIFDIAPNANTDSDPTPTSQFTDQNRPIMLALNIPTYINLYGYGYRNIYELHELVNVDDPRIELVGSIVNMKQ